ncbi:hypothetical protein BBL07_13140 [Agrobacterium vitis]|nr:hypothetical protein BBL07_13140 [Agrobacterium vitis]
MFPSPTLPNTKKDLLSAIGIRKPVSMPNFVQILNKSLRSNISGLKYATKFFAMLQDLFCLFFYVIIALCIDH